MPHKTCCKYILWSGFVEKKGVFTAFISISMVYNHLFLAPFLCITGSQGLFSPYKLPPPPPPASGQGTNHFANRAHGPYLFLSAMAESPITSVAWREASHFPINQPGIIYAP
jgi:hypothetical protein